MHGLPHGRGQLKWKGGRADLPFVEGVPHGEGAEVLLDPDGLGGPWYRGPLDRGVRVGRGSARLPDGSEYEGGFEEDGFSGRGSLQLAGGVRFDGWWRDGKRHGRGVTLGAQGERLEARYSEDSLAGPSRFWYRLPLSSRHAVLGAPLAATFSSADRPVRLTFTAAPQWLLCERRRASLPHIPPQIDASLFVTGEHTKLSLRVQRSPPGAVRAFLSLCRAPSTLREGTAPPAQLVVLELFAVTDARPATMAQWACAAQVRVAPILEWEEPQNPTATTRATR